MGGVVMITEIWFESLVLLERGFRRFHHACGHMGRCAARDGYFVLLFQCSRVTEQLNVIKCRLMPLYLQLVVFFASFYLVGRMQIGDAPLSLHEHDVGNISLKMARRTSKFSRKLVCLGFQ